MNERTMRTAWSGARSCTRSRTCALRVSLATLVLAATPHGVAHAQGTGPGPSMPVTPTTPGVAISPMPAPECGAGLPAHGRQSLQAPGYQLVLAPQVWPIPVGKHFAVDIAVCPAAGQPQPTSVRVDADMPAHRHGMNYRATVQPAAGAPGRYSAQGLMFHMPGQWRFIVDVSGPAGQVRATREVTVQ